MQQKFKKQIIGGQINNKIIKIKKNITKLIKFEVLNQIKQKKVQLNRKKRIKYLNNPEGKKKQQLRLMRIKLSQQQQYLMSFVQKNRKQQEINNIKGKLNNILKIKIKKEDDWRILQQNINQISDRYKCELKSTFPFIILHYKSSILTIESDYSEKKTYDIQIMKNKQKFQSKIIQEYLIILKLEQEYLKNLRNQIPNQQLKISITALQIQQKIKKWLTDLAQEYKLKLNIQSDPEMKIEYFQSQKKIYLKTKSDQIHISYRLDNCFDQEFLLIRKNIITDYIYILKYNQHRQKERGYQTQLRKIIEVNLQKEKKFTEMKVQQQFQQQRRRIRKIQEQERYQKENIRRENYRKNQVLQTQPINLNISYKMSSYLTKFMLINCLFNKPNEATTKIFLFYQFKNSPVMLYFFQIYMSFILIYQLLNCFFDCQTLIMFLANYIILCVLNLKQQSIAQAGFWFYILLLKNFQHFSLSILIITFFGLKHLLKLITYITCFYTYFNVQEAAQALIEQLVFNQNIKFISVILVQLIQQKSLVKVTVCEHFYIEDAEFSVTIISNQLLICLIQIHCHLVC